jgi:ABC-type Zn uptake system ZnuABC Zn-binding protein ZnuA
MISTNLRLPENNFRYACFCSNSLKIIRFVLLLCMFLFVSCSLNDNKDVGKRVKPLVLCSTTQIADFARQVAGDRCDVVSVLSPGSDPHTYQPTTGDAKTALKADLCLENGFHLEGKNWMASLAKDAGKPIVTCALGVQPIFIESKGETIRDPHTWFTPRNAAIYINNIREALIHLDPDGEYEYSARSNLYLKNLRSLDAWIREHFNSIPSKERILVTSHDAFNYFASEYGFKNSAPVGWSTGSEVGGGMTPSRYRLVVESIRKLGVKAVFVETSVNPKLIREIGEAAGVKIGGMLFSDSMGEAGSAGETYIGMMRENVLTICKALKKEK